MRITKHAQDAYAIFYPHAPAGELSAMLDAATEVPPEIAIRMVGRAAEPRPGSLYRLHPQRTGLFVAVDDGDGEEPAVVTFLRFYARSQRDLALALYGEDQQLDPSLLWRFAPPHDGAAQVLGVPVADVVMSGAHEPLRASIASVAWEPVAKPYPVQVGDYTGKATHEGRAGSRRLMLTRLDDGGVMVSGYQAPTQAGDATKPARRQHETIPWLGVPASAIRFSRASLGASGMNTGPFSRLSTEHRAALVDAPCPPTVPGGYLLDLPGGRCVLHQRPVGGAVGWMVATEAECAPTLASVEHAIAILRRAGWLVSEMAEIAHPDQGWKAGAA